MLIALYRRYRRNHQFFTDVDSDGSDADADGAIKKKRFRTSGTSVALLTLLSFSAYVILLVLTWRLSNTPID